MPLCRSAEQTGCVITYVSFRSTIPPPPDSRFGRVQGEGMEAGCTNPAALAGGKGPLHAYLSAAPARDRRQPRPPPSRGSRRPRPINTPFVSVPGLLTAQCVSNEKGSYLEVTVNGDPHDPRTDDIAGDVIANGKVVPSWGLHLIDVHDAYGQPGRDRAEADEVVSGQTEPLRTQTEERHEDTRKHETLGSTRVSWASCLRGFLRGQLQGASRPLAAARRCRRRSSSAAR